MVTVCTVLTFTETQPIDERVGPNDDTKQKKGIKQNVPKLNVLPYSLPNKTIFYLHCSKPIKTNVEMICLTVHVWSWNLLEIIL